MPDLDTGYGKLYLSGLETFRQMAAVEEKALQTGALDRKIKAWL